MAETSKIAANLERFRQAIRAHDEINPPPHSPAHGIGLSGFDLGRLGFDDGEELWAGVRVQVDGKTAGNFRVLCDGEHDECDLRIKEAREAQERERFAIEPQEPIYA